MYEKDLEIKDNNPKWMKLVDLYNERREERFWEKWYFLYENRFDTVHLCSKRMWFIQRLVKKHAIEIPMSMRVIRSYDKEEWYNRYTDEESILILLALSENPISLLLSLLV